MSAWFSEYGFGAIEARLLTGAQPSDVDDAAQLRAAGVTHVLNLCEDEEYPDGAHAAVAASYRDAGIVEHRLSTEDFGGLSPALLEAASGWALDALTDGATLYVHCRAGWQRSATVAAATLARRDGVGVEEALATVRAAREQARPLRHQVDGLRDWWVSRSEGPGEPESRDVP